LLLGLNEKRGVRLADAVVWLVHIEKLTQQGIAAWIKLLWAEGADSQAFH
jgi:hypothetical protein